MSVLVLNYEYIYSVCISHITRMHTSVFSSLAVYKVRSFADADLHTFYTGGWHSKQSSQETADGESKGPSTIWTRTGMGVT